MTSIQLTLTQRTVKRTFDLVLAIIGLILTLVVIIVAWLIASIDTRSNGFFIQERVGRYGTTFKVVKIKTMRPVAGNVTTVTRLGDPRITKIGSWFRKAKIDELPQIWNVLLGHMSFVGPRPDVPGFADKLKGEAREILRLRPGITGPATLKYRNEEELLAIQSDPERFNREFIFPDKVRINLDYMRDWSIKKDLNYIWRTIFE